MIYTLFVQYYTRGDRRYRSYVPLQEIEELTL